MTMQNGYPDMQELVAKANAIRLDFPTTPDGFTPFDFVRGLVDANDLVFGVWQETEMQPACVILKGRAVLDNIRDCGVAEELSWTAIPLRSLEEGAALQEVLGLPRTIT